MRYVALVLACALGAGTAGAGPSDPFAQDSPTRRVRPTTALARKALTDGLAHSATFRRLVQRLEASDVIVYIELRPRMPSDVGGMLEFMGGGGTNRFLRITLGIPNHLSTIVTLLGHELQHAVEVADAPEVDTLVQFTSFYRRIGVPSGAGRYDSLAAREAGYTVLAELHGKASLDDRLARHARGARDGLNDGGSIAMP